MIALSTIERHWFGREDCIKDVKHGFSIEFETHHIYPFVWREIARWNDGRSFGHE